MKEELEKLLDEFKLDIKQTKDDIDNAYEDEMMN